MPAGVPQYDVVNTSSTCGAGDGSVSTISIENGSSESRMHCRVKPQSMSSCEYGASVRGPSTIVLRFTTASSTGLLSNAPPVRFKYTIEGRHCASVEPPSLLQLARTRTQHNRIATSL